MSIRRDFTTGIRWSLLGSVFAAVVALVQLLVMARLLSSTDFALFALVNLVLPLFMQLIQSSLHSAIIHHQSVTAAQLTSLFWLNLLGGLALALLMALVGPLMAWLFRAPALSGLYAFSGLILAVLGASVTSRALLQKALDFSRLALAQALASLLSFGLAVWLALAGFGAYVLPAALLARYTVEGISIVLLSPFRPALQFRAAGLRPFLRFGGFQSGERLVSHAVGQLDTVLVGKFLGMEALGIYDLMKRVLIRPSNLLSELVERVAFPTMARIQHRQGILRRFYLKMIGQLLPINYWAYGLGFALAPLLSGWLFGPQGAPYTALFRLICLYAMLNSITNPLDSLLAAIGRIGHWMYISLAYLPVLALAIWLGLPFGISGTVAAILLAHLALVGFSFASALAPLLKMPAKAYFGALARPAVHVAPLVLAGTLLLEWAKGPYALIAAVVTALAFAGLFIMLYPDVFSVIKIRRPGKRKALW